MNKLKFFIMIFIIIFIDQISKFLVVLNRDNLPITIINGVLKFSYCENRGIAFGMASGHVTILAIITLIILIGIVFVFWKNILSIKGVGFIGATMLIAGGVGNLIDRIFRAYVVDFIDFSSLINFPIFNIADICVVLGVVLIGVYYIQKNKMDSNYKIKK